VLNDGSEKGWRIDAKRGFLILTIRKSKTVPFVAVPQLEQL
jgi:hypothetical protein